MSFKINGVEIRRIIVEENGSATDLTHLQTYKNGVLQTVWTRPPCKLSITKGSHCTVIVVFYLKIISNFLYFYMCHFLIKIRCVVQSIRDMSCEKESFFALTSGCPPWCKPQYERGEG